MASEGYIVIATNRRGCPGFGQDWVDAIIKDYSGKPMDDIITAVDDLASEPYVDKNRIAAIGGSAGGYAAFWLAGNNSNGRFKAFISHCGLFNMISKYASKARRDGNRIHDVHAPIVEPVSGRRASAGGATPQSETPP